MELVLSMQRVITKKCNETDEIIEELFKSLLERYQEWLEESMRERIFFLSQRRSFVFFYDSVDLLYYTLHKIRLNHGRAYPVSPERLKSKKEKYKINNEKGLQYAVTVTLNYIRCIK